MLTSAAIKRLIEPAEVAELVAYLCTDVAGFITGTRCRSTAAGPHTRAA